MGSWACRIGGCTPVSIGGPTRLAAWSCPAGGGTLPYRYAGWRCHAKSTLSLVRPARIRQLSQPAVLFLFSSFVLRLSQPKRQTVISPPSLFLSLSPPPSFFRLLLRITLLLPLFPPSTHSNPRKRRRVSPDLTHDPFLVQRQTPTSNPASWLHDTRHDTDPTGPTTHTHTREC